MKHKIIIFLTLAAILASCAAHTNIEPTGKNIVSASVSVGGPFVSAFDTKIPVPYLMGGVDYGITDRLDVNTNLHIITLGYELAGLDAGLTYYPLLNDGIIPVIGIHGHLMTFYSFKSGVEDRWRAYPVFSVTSAWDVHNGKFYIGSDLVTPTTELDYNQGLKYPIVSPFIGYRWDMSRRSMFYFEIKWQGVNVQTHQLAVEYIHPFNYGALGLFLSFERSL